MMPMPDELRTFVDIDATPERVWRVLTDLPAYAEWNPFITRVEGPLVVGGRLSVSVPPVNAFVQPKPHPTVLEVVPYRRLRVRSSLDRLGLRGLFKVDVTITITDHDRGVRLWWQDDFRGILAPLLIASMNHRRLPAFNAMTVALKDRAESSPEPRPE
jgi:hypothetical protein